MTTSKLVFGAPGAEGSQAFASLDRPLLLAGLVGVVFTVVGFLDILLAWIPPQLGNAQWEFGTISATLNGMPLPTLGLVLLYASGVGRGMRWPIVLVTVIAFLVTLFLLMMAVFYALSLPVVIKAAAQPGAARLIIAAVTKAVAAMVGYLLAYAALAMFALRSLRS